MRDFAKTELPAKLRAIVERSPRLTQRQQWAYLEAADAIETLQEALKNAAPQISPKTQVEGSGATYPPSADAAFLKAPIACKQPCTRDDCWITEKCQANAAPQASPSVAPAVHAGPAVAASPGPNNEQNAAPQGAPMATRGVLGTSPGASTPAVAAPDMPIAEPNEPLKKAISAILLKAVQGVEPKYMYEGKYTRWGLIEADIHAEIDRLMPFDATSKGQS